VIDWVDFIKWDGVMYDRIYSGVLADEKYIGEKLGTVKFKVADNITNPSYKVKNGDAAFHEKGTELFTIKDMPGFIAVKSEHALNGYSVYSEESSDYKWHFKDMPQEKIQRIEIYHVYREDGDKRIFETSNPQTIQTFLSLLNNSEENPPFNPNTEQGDPLYYEALFYIDGPFAYQYGIQFDGHTYYWYPWETSILSKEIKEFFQ